MSMLNDLPPEKVQALKEMYETLMENEEIYFAYPGLYGMVGDWFAMYWDLHNKCLEFMNEEPYHDPMLNREEYHRVKNSKGG